MQDTVAETAVCFRFECPCCNVILCFVHRVINVLIKRGRVLTECGRPSEWELAGAGVKVVVFGGWLSMLALLHLQLILNKSTELSWHWLTGL